MRNLYRKGQGRRLLPRLVNRELFPPLTPHLLKFLLSLNNITGWASKLCNMTHGVTSFSNSTIPYTHFILQETIGSSLLVSKISTIPVFLKSPHSKFPLNQVNNPLQEQDRTNDLHETRPEPVTSARAGTREQPLREQA